MTTDPFTEAARAEAERWWPGIAGPTILALGAHMAEWARAHLAAQEPTDEEVEAAAEAILEAAFGQELPEAPIDLARAALSAARHAREEPTR